MSPWPITSSTRQPANTESGPSSAPRPGRSPVGGAGGGGGVAGVRGLLGGGAGARGGPAGARGGVAGAGGALAGAGGALGGALAGGAAAAPVPVTSMVVAP